MKKIIMNLDAIIACITLSIMTILAFVNVVSRYVLQASISYTDEVTTNLFVLGSLAGASIAAKRGGHMGLDLLVEFVPKKVALIIQMITNALGAVFGAVCTVCTIDLMMDQFERGQIAPAMQIPEGIYMSFLAIGMAMVAASFATCMVEKYKEYKTLCGEGGEK